MRARKCGCRYRPATRKSEGYRPEAGASDVQFLAFVLFVGEGARIEVSQAVSVCNLDVKRLRGVTRTRAQLRTNTAAHAFAPHQELRMLRVGVRTN